MEMLKFFICFLIVVESSVTANWAELKRVKSSITVNDVLEFTSATEGSNDFENVYKSLKNTYKYNNVAPIGMSVLTEQLFKTYHSLEDVNDQLMCRSAVYLTRVLRRYLELAKDVVNSDWSLLSTNRVDDTERREALRFGKPLEYCMLTAFYDSKVCSLEADLLFESTYFLQTVDPESSAGELKSKLKLYIDRCDRILEINGVDALPLGLADISFVAYQTALNDVKKKIRDFSHAFCTSWTPFIRLDHLRAETLQFDDVHLQSPFVRYTFHNEICEINFHQISGVLLKEPKFANHSGIQDEDRQNQITTWKCDTVLDSREFRYQIYMADVDFGDNRDKIHSGDVMFRRKPPVPAAGGTAFNNREYLSLAALRTALKSNPHYLNAVKYYNVVAEVMLLAAIKEGNKLLRGIKLVVLSSAKRTLYTLRARDMREMRSVLYEFKTMMDRLVALILRKRRINVTDNVERETFANRAISVMESLDVQNDVQLADGQYERICAEILKTLQDIRYHGLIRSPRKFESFYFNETILNIREMYHFGENGF